MAASSLLGHRQVEQEGQMYEVRCAYCDRFITGKVLQAGDNTHFHPTCARCTKCGDPFGDGEEMFMQGAAIWHPRCGPGMDMSKSEQGHLDQMDINTPYASRYSSLSSTRSRSISPMYASSLYPSQFTSQRTTPNYFSRSASHHQLKYGRSRSPGFTTVEPMYTDLSRVYASTYLHEDADTSHLYLRKPVEPKPPKSPQFHRPTYSSASSSRARSTSRGRYPEKRRPGMQVMVDHLLASSPRPRSPHMNNEEPIELSHYPPARKPEPNEKAPIERDDFPAPPYPYAGEIVEEERKRRSGRSSRASGVSGGDVANLNDVVDVTGEAPIANIDDEVDSMTATYEDPQLKKEEEELSKIATGIGKVFLREIKEREKLKAWKLSHLDPRNASRNPSAKNELPRRLRYDNPVNASPSRDADRPKPWDEDDLDMASVFRSSGGKTAYTSTLNYNVVSSLRSVPRPGYGMRSYTPGLSGYRSSSPSSRQLSKTHSIEFSSAKSDISAKSEVATPSHKPNGTTSGHVPPTSTTQTWRGITPYYEGEYYTGSVAGSTRGSSTFGYRTHSSPSYSAHLRRSMPNVNFHLHTNEPAKLYPYHLLVTTNYRLPPSVDRCHLERHLSTEEFMSLFHMSRVDFYRLPEWRRNDLKKRVRLF